MCRMQVEQTSQQLVHEVGVVLIRQRLLRMYQTAQVCFHLLRHDVDVLVVGLMARFLDIDQFYDVLMLKKL